MKAELVIIVAENFERSNIDVSYYIGKGSTGCKSIISV